MGVSGIYIFMLHMSGHLGLGISQSYNYAHEHLAKYGVFSKQVPTTLRKSMVSMFSEGSMIRITHENGLVEHQGRGSGEQLKPAPVYINRKGRIVETKLQKVKFKTGLNEQFMSGPRKIEAGSLNHHGNNMIPNTPSTVGTLRTDSIHREESAAIYPIINTSGRRHTVWNKEKRRRRQTATPYNVELLTVVDYATYQHWFEKTSEQTDRHAATVELITDYMTYMVNAIDVRFKTIRDASIQISVLNAGVFIADNPDSSPWSEKYHVNGKLDSGSVLDAFTEWLNNQTDLPSYDHAMAFTRYDVTSVNSNGLADSTGIAFTGAICTRQSTSLVEDSPNFVTMTTAAHELAHSLGAVHDGSGSASTCQNEDNYVMSDSHSINAGPVLGQNLWRFSPCSLEAFRRKIAELDSNNDNCLLNTSASAKMPTTPRPMAETYSPDDTCVENFGNGSYVCRSVQDYETICTSMFCNEPGTSQCYSVIPPEGTPCGKGKWCERGRCVTSPDAPNDVTDTCPLGDRPGLYEDMGVTCAEFVTQDPPFCYGHYTEANCCESCSRVKSSNPDCPYGDKFPMFCTRYNATNRYGCYQLESDCCTTCPQLKNAALPGCEFGDKLEGCRKEDCGNYEAQTRENCCETCAGYTPTTTTTTTTTTTSSTTSKPTTTVKQRTTTEKPITTSTRPITTTARPITTTTRPITTEKPITTTTTSGIDTTEPHSSPVSTTRTTRSPTTTKARVTTPSSSKNTMINPTRTTSKPNTREPTTTTEYFVTTEPDELILSDFIVAAVGAGAGAIVLILVVVIICILIRRKRAKSLSPTRPKKEGRPHDNVGIVTSEGKVMSPKPQRSSSGSASQNKQKEPCSPTSTLENGYSTYCDGYMMPAPSIVSVTSNTSHGVHYTAPDKLNFLATLKNKGMRAVKKTNSAHAQGHLANGGHDETKRVSKAPIHYKRSSGTKSNSMEVDAEPYTVIPFENERKNSDTYDSIGELFSKIPQNRRPTLPENHPGRLSDSKQSNDCVQSHANGITRRSSFPSTKVQPHPVPRARIRSNEKPNQGQNDPYLDMGYKDANHVYDQADNIVMETYNVPLPRLPSKHQRRTKSSAQNSHINRNRISSSELVPRSYSTNTVNETVICAEFQTASSQLPQSANGGQRIKVGQREPTAQIAPIRPVPRQRVPSGPESQSQAQMKVIQNGPSGQGQNKPEPMRPTSNEYMGIVNPNFDPDYEVRI